MYVSFDFEVKVANKSELDTSASVRYKLHVIDADAFNSDSFSHHFNEGKTVTRMFSHYSISSVYLLNSFNSSFTSQSLPSVAV